MNGLDYSIDNDQPEITEYLKKNYPAYDLSVLTKIETKLPYDIVLDKIFIHNGPIIGEYGVQDIETSTLNNLPETKAKEYILSWIGNVENEEGEDDDLRDEAGTKECSPKSDIYRNVTQRRKKNYKLGCSLFNLNVECADMDNNIENLEGVRNKVEENKDFIKNRENEMNIKNAKNTQNTKCADVKLNLSSMKNKDTLNVKITAEMTKNLNLNKIPLEDNEDNKENILYNSNDKENIPSEKNEETEIKFTKNIPISNIAPEKNKTYKKAFVHYKESSRESGIQSLPESTFDLSQETSIYTQTNKPCGIVSLNEPKKIRDTSSDYFTCNEGSSVNILDQNVFEITSDLSSYSLPASSKSINSNNEFKQSDVNNFNISELYKYIDEEEDIILFEKRLLVSPTQNLNKSIVSTITSQSSKVSSLPQNLDYDTDSLRKELKSRGFEPGPITKTTKRIYLKKLHKLRKNPMVHQEVKSKKIGMYII